MPKTKKVKAEARTWEFRNAYGHYCGEELVWTLHRTPEAYDAMVEQMAMAMATYTWAAATNSVKGYWREDARRALRAIGIMRPKEDQP